MRSPTSGFHGQDVFQRRDLGFNQTAAFRRSFKHPGVNDRLHGLYYGISVVSVKAIYGQSVVIPAQQDRRTNIGASRLGDLRLNAFWKRNITALKTKPETGADGTIGL